GLARGRLRPQAVRQVPAAAGDPAARAVGLLRRRRPRGEPPAIEPGDRDRPPPARLRERRLPRLGGSPRALVAGGAARIGAGAGRVSGPRRRRPRAAEPAPETSGSSAGIRHPPPPLRLLAADDAGPRPRSHRAALRPRPGDPQDLALA